VEIAAIYLAAVTVTNRMFIKIVKNFNKLGRDISNKLIAKI